MIQVHELQARYVIDEAGNKTAVILPIEEFEELLEDLEDMAVLIERRDESTIPFEEVKKNLRHDGTLEES
jgi:PHD/YefM family antitoxin component YafN of YafNO toxin-antitoxin module